MRWGGLNVKLDGGDKRVEAFMSILIRFFMALISANLRSQITSLTLRQSPIQNACEPFHFLKNALFLKCRNMMINPLSAHCADTQFHKGFLA
jgi:hypothetical protein